MPAYKGFIGPSYTGRGLTAAGERCINFFPESMRGAAGPENQYVLLPTPGTQLFAALPGGLLAGLYTEPATGRLFAVSGSTLYEMQAGGVYASRGTLPPGSYYTFASNGQQMMISSSGGGGYLFTLATNALTPIAATGFLGTYQCAMLDNYFISLIPNSRKFQISSLLDGTQWDGLDFALTEGGAENHVGMIVDHRELWIFGSRHAEIFTDTGAAGFPFERINSTFIEQGLAAPRSLVQLDNTIFWLGTNQHGQARVFRAEGYIPKGVSNRAVEYWFNLYAKNGGIADAVAYAYQDESGHSFYVISFPSVTGELAATGGMQNGVVNGATWVYDVTEDCWHERSRLVGGQARMHSTVHAFAFGKHFVGGTDNTGNVYELSTEVYTDQGNPIKRTRRAPHLVDELKWISYHKFRLNAQVGTGPLNASDNTVSLRSSNDGGYTWSNEYQSKPLGAAGNYRQIVEWRRLGRSMRRSFEITTTIAAPICLVDAYLEVTEGTR